MSVTTERRPNARVRLAVPALAVFGPTIALSAVLLFSVEPFVGRLALPVFGGTPAVWATVLFFFQTILLLGYLYGHVSATRLGPRLGPVLHVVLAAVALVWLIVAPARYADLRLADLPAVVNLLGILALTIGPPALLVTTSTPLLSAWYAVARLESVDGSGDPYWLYALSNAGSLVALLGYPLVIEPRLGLASQRTAWTAGFALFCLLLAGCAWWAAHGSLGVPSGKRADRAGDRAATSHVDWRRRGRWLLLAAVPSGLLAAVTNFITTDLVSAPLLWVGPLAIYLATFVVAFSSRGRRIQPVGEWLVPAVITLLWVPFGSSGGWPIAPLLLLEFAGLAVVATTLHGRLALDRPDPAHLTDFYLVLSAGGVLGGAFVAILAPSAFKGVWEYPILLVGALVALALARPGPTGPEPARLSGASTQQGGRGRLDLRPFVMGAPRRLAPYVVVGGLLTAGLVLDRSPGLEAAVRWLVVGGLILLVGGQPRFLAAATSLVLALAILVIQPAAIFRDRSFFGVVEVLRPAGGSSTVLMNGTTIHGVQSTNAELRGVPASYYSPSGPLGDVFDGLRSASKPDNGRSIGVVGLGAGAVAAYMGPDDALTFYEIDPLVVQVATDERYFTFLADAPIDPGIVLGDARLSLERVPDGTHELLVLDAFSSDSIPTHLLTAEAIADDARVTRPDGVLAFHLSNRYYDLAPAVAASAERLGLTVLRRAYAPTAEESLRGAGPADWLVATRHAAIIDFLARKGWQPVPTGSVVPFTDDYADLLGLLRPAW